VVRARLTGTPTLKVEFIREYWSDVFTPSMAAYEAGHTPNPDVMCNREIKFKRFLHLCQSRFQAHYIATGAQPIITIINKQTKIITIIQKTILVLFLLFSIE
jgi:tRNA-specific 2-thiouridylase